MEYLVELLNIGLVYSPELSRGEGEAVLKGAATLWVGLPLAKSTALSPYSKWNR